MKILKSLHFVSWYKRSVVDGIRNRRGEPVAINIPGTVQPLTNRTLCYKFYSHHVHIIQASTCSLDDVY